MTIQDSPFTCGRVRKVLHHVFFRNANRRENICSPPSCARVSGLR